MKRRSFAFLSAVEPAELTLTIDNQGSTLPIETTAQIGSTISATVAATADKRIAFLPVLDTGGQVRTKVIHLDIGVRFVGLPIR